MPRPSNGASSPEAPESAERPGETPTPSDADGVFVERQRRARQMAAQSWPEFLRDTLVKTLLIAVGIALAVLVLLALSR